jgi:hypothetical protein
MRNKKGIEIAVNFLVIIIVSIVMFIGAISLTVKIFGGGSSAMQQMDENTKRQIRNLVGPNDKVNIPYHQKLVRIGDSIFFGVGVYNVIKEETNFTVTVNFDKAYFENRTRIIEADASYIDNNWNPFFKDGRNYTLKRNERYVVEISLGVESNINTTYKTIPGIYAFDVNVSYYNSTGSANLYDGRIMKIYMEVEE